MVSCVDPESCFFFVSIFFCFSVIYGKLCGSRILLFFVSILFTIAWFNHLLGLLQVLFLIMCFHIGHTVYITWEQLHLHFWFPVIPMFLGHCAMWTEMASSHLPNSPWQFMLFFAASPAYRCPVLYPHLLSSRHLSVHPLLNQASLDKCRRLLVSKDSAVKSWDQWPHLWWQRALSLGLVWYVAV